MNVILYTETVTYIYCHSTCNSSEGTWKNSSQQPSDRTACLPRIVG